MNRSAKTETRAKGAATGVPGSAPGEAGPQDLQRQIVEALEFERARMAREIHDGPAQALSNAILQLEVVERLLARDPALAGAELRLLRDVLRRELDNMRSYISELRPPILADLGLAGAIRDTADHVAGLVQIPISVDVDPAIAAVPASAHLVVLRIIQEALQNVRKHADATSVSIRAVIDGEDVALEIRDNGRGFDRLGALEAGRRKFGIQFMRERAESIGAQFEVRSHPDDGTLVRLVIHGTAEETT